MSKGAVLWTISLVSVRALGFLCAYMVPSSSVPSAIVDPRWSSIVLMLC